MSCECTTNACLTLRNGYCDEETIFNLPADQTGNWEMRYEFNGRMYREVIAVTSGEYISTTALFNKMYIHKVMFYKIDGSLYNDTCYSVDFSQLPMNATQDTGTSSKLYELTYTIVVDPDPDNPDEQAAGVTIVDDRLIGATVNYIVSSSTQVYNKAWFTKNKNSNTLTLTAIAATSVGDILTLNYTK